MQRMRRIGRIHKGHELATQRLDMVVDQKLVVQIKATYQLPPDQFNPLNPWNNRPMSLRSSSQTSQARPLS